MIICAPLTDPGLMSSFHYIYSRPAHRHARHVTSHSRMDTLAYLSAVGERNMAHIKSIIHTYGGASAQRRGEGGGRGGEEVLFQAEAEGKQFSSPDMIQSPAFH